MVRLRLLARRRKVDTEERAICHVSYSEQLAVHRCRKPQRRNIPSHVPDQDPHNCRVLGSPPTQVPEPKQVGFAPLVSRGRRDRPG